MVLPLTGVSLDSLWVDTEAEGAHVVTMVSSGPGLVTAGGMAYEGGRFICGMSPESEVGQQGVWLVLQSPLLFGILMSRS